MKWYRVFFPGARPPARLVHDYSDDELGRFADDFRPRAKRYRRRRLIAASMLAGFILFCVVLSETRLGNLEGVWGAVLLGACWLGAALILAVGMRLACPACRKRLAPATGPYCPQCGSDQYQSGRHLRGPLLSRRAYCPSCQNTIDEGGGDPPRSYRIRRCTHCGVMLDEKGL